MIRKVLFIFLILCSSLLFCMCGNNVSEKNNKNRFVNDEEITIHNMNYNVESTIYNLKYQKKLYDEVSDLKKSGNFTIENPLVIINPFGTNTTGVYIYFKSSLKSYVKYTIHVNDESINDFSEILNNGLKNNLSKEHEYVLIGGIPGKENIITLDLFDKNSELSNSKTFRITIPELDPGSDYILEKGNVPDVQEMSDGLFVTMGHINNENGNTNTYYYDNNGVCRAQIKLDNYRIDRIVFNNSLMYISVDTNRIAALDRLGYVKNVYDLGKYEMHHDYTLGDNGNLLILVSDTETNSSEDKVISLNLKTGEIKEIIDFGVLLPDIKEKAVLPEGKDKLDWIHLNALSLLNDKTALFSSRELSTIINVGDIYDNPSINYLIADKKIWDDTIYSHKVYSKDGIFQIHGGQHSIDVINDNDLENGLYYINMYNNNTGVSSHYPDYDWGKAENIDTDSMYYKYLVNENTKSYSLVKEIVLLPSRYISSVQEFKNHIIADSGQSKTIYEFDSSDKLIAQYSLKETMWGLYRCFKYDFNNFYFHKIS